MYKINNKNWLSSGSGVKHKASKKNTEKFVAGQPDTIIIHYTAGRDAESSATYLARDDVKASAHIVIGRDGDIIQLVPFDTVAWHAGKSSYDGRIGYNRYSIGIELDNAGILEQTGDGFISWFGKQYPANEVIRAIHHNESVERCWHTFTEKQIDAVTQLCEILIARYNTITQILGHDEISPGRKQDPGPAFPLARLRNRILQDRDSDMPIHDDMEGMVDVNRLNIRELPSIDADTITSPLPQGTKVKILQKHQGWYKVKTELEGWVASEYISLKS